MQILSANKISFGKLRLNDSSINRCMDHKQIEDLYRAKDSFEKEIQELDEQGVDIKVYGIPGTGDPQYQIIGYKKNGAGENMASHSLGWSAHEMMECAIKTAKHLLKVYRED